MKCYFFRKISADLWISLGAINGSFTDSISENGADMVKNLDLDLNHNECLIYGNGMINVVALTQELKSQHDFEDLKVQKYNLLRLEYESTKVITLQNGNTLIIKGNTPERDIFFQNLENLQKLDNIDNAILTYWQEEDGTIYQFSALSYIWRYMFSALFLKSENGIIKGTIRGQNKNEYLVNNLKIQKAQTVSDLDSVTWNFINPHGMVIDINEKSRIMLNDIQVPEYVKNIIASAMDANGQIHLIQKI